MAFQPLTRRSTVRDVYRTAVGRDAIDKLLLQSGVPRAAVTAAGPLRLSLIDRLTSRYTGPGFIDAIIKLVNSEADLPLEGLSPDPVPWWQEAVFYQIYPRSFADSDGDGIGDLRGIISHLDHLADLGVDCVWLSPIFDSPNQDMGYDVRDYRAVMEEMGTLEDLDELIRGCHERGMRIILDLVVNHTSDQHAWFQEALLDPDGPYGDYYFLERGDPKTPPNNWTSFFSGPAWRWFPEAGRWALHLFADGQMDLRWDNPDVRREVADIVGWWLERGIDGFRLDVINYISKPEGLPDGNAFVGALMGFVGVEHYFYGPRLGEFLRGLRRDGFTRDRPPASTPRRRLEDGTLGDPLPPDPVGVMVGETPGVGVQLGRLLSGGGRDQLDLIFNFDVLDTPGHTRWDDYVYDPEYLKRFYRTYLSELSPNDWIAVFLDNHDNPRMLSKLAGGAERDPAVRTAVGKLLATVQLTMRGTPFLYQGQELAAVNQGFEHIDQLRDVESVNRHAELLAEGVGPRALWRQILAGSRDHARVPMRWTREGGFGDAVAWLEGHDETPGFSAAEQVPDPASVYAWHRDLIALRRHHRALTLGELTWVRPEVKGYLAYERSLDGERFLIETNPTPKQRRRPKLTGRIVPVLGGPRKSTMRPWEAIVSRID